MMLRNGVRAVGLGFSAWLLCLGTLAAQDASPADEPPLPPNVEQDGPKLIDLLNSICSDGPCQACKTKACACESADSPAIGCVDYLGGASCSQAKSYGVTWQRYGLSEVRHELDVAGHWGAGDVLELVWYGAPQFSVVSDACGACRVGSCAACCEPLSALDYLWTECETTPAAGDLTVYCDGLNCSEITSVEPGEPAEVLLEIRSLVASSPLQGTAYQPMDSTSCARAQNAFVTGVRESAEACAATAENGAKDSHTEPSVTEAANPWQPQLPVSRTSSEKLIVLMRQVSRDLEESANTLEDADVYYRADQLRQLAAELRLEARTAGGSWSLEPLGMVPRTMTPEPQRDLARENEELRAELERLRESLRASQPATDRITR